MSIYSFNLAIINTKVLYMNTIQSHMFTRYWLNMKLKIKNNSLMEIKDNWCYSFRVYEFVEVISIFLLQIMCEIITLV